jgi:hypothetical protein
MRQIAFVAFAISVAVPLATTSAGQSARAGSPAPPAPADVWRPVVRDAERVAAERLAIASAALRGDLAQLGIKADEAQWDGDSIRIRGHVTITIGDKVITTEEATIK